MKGLPDYMKKRELLITAGILLAAVLLWLGIRLASPRSSASIRITVDGNEFGVFSLSKDCTIPIGDTNVCEIQGGKAHMLSADCPDQICVHQGYIDENGGIITCLPNRVVIQAAGGEDTLDGVS